MLAAPQRFVDYYGSTGSLMNGIAGFPARTILVSVMGWSSRFLERSALKAADWAMAF